MDASEISNSYTVLDEFGELVERQRRGKADERYFVALGKRVESLILKKGYRSPYAFWLEHGDEGLSRSNLNYLINGKSDPKLSTLRRIAEGLEIEIADLFRGL